MTTQIHHLYHHRKANIRSKHGRAIQLLNDLIRINKDRITGYESTAHDHPAIDADIRDAFYHLATESRSYVNDLHAQVIRLDGPPVSQETISGKIYLFWLDMRASLKGETLTDLLDTCMAVERAMQQAYGKALECEDDLPENIRHLITSQLWALENAHERMKKLCTKYSLQYDQSDRPR